jgi:alpha,alpha-trehalase
MKTRIGMALVASVLFIAHPALAFEQPVAPQVLFEDLYADVELQRIFPDSKEFADATPKLPPPAEALCHGAFRPARRSCRAIHRV